MTPLSLHVYYKASNVLGPPLTPAEPSAPRCCPFLLPGQTRRLRQGLRPISIGLEMSTTQIMVELNLSESLTSPKQPPCSLHCTCMSPCTYTRAIHMHTCSEASPLSPHPDRAPSSHLSFPPQSPTLTTNSHFPCPSPSGDRGDTGDKGLTRQADSQGKSGGQ